MKRQGYDAEEGAGKKKQPLEWSPVVHFYDNSFSLGVTDNFCGK